MQEKINCIMLIDDNKHDNFFHERTIRKYGFTKTVVVKESGEKALEYLLHPEDPSFVHPDLIFLDINMPGMNGWEFLEEYKKLSKNLQSKVVVIMLTTSENPADVAKATAHEAVVDYKTKPLTIDMLKEIAAKYF